MTLPAGAMGAPTPVDGRPRRRQVAADAARPQVARADALAQAREAGILGSGVLRSRELFASFAGTGDITSGLDDADLLGAWEGGNVGAAEGWGNGPAGTGPGGGGDDPGSVWTGAYRTIGDGDDAGDGYVPGTGSCRGPRCGDRRRPVVPAVKIGPPSGCQGDAGCDPSIVRRYVKRWLPKISHCYERQLLVDPGLAGTVTAVFTVLPTGRVAQSDASGVSGEVAACVASVLAAIEFPRFDGAFQVRYPFHFHRAGG
jgi:hypothetical protein